MDAADIDAVYIDWRMAVLDPLRKHKAGTAGRLNADRIEASRNEQVLYLRCFAQIVAVVGRKTFRTVEEERNACRFKKRNAFYRIVQDRLEVLHVFGEGLERMVLWDAVRRPRLRHWLK